MWGDVGARKEKQIEGQRKKKENASTWGAKILLLRPESGLFHTNWKGKQTLVKGKKSDREKKRGRI